MASSSSRVCRRAGAVQYAATFGAAVRITHAPFSLPVYFAFSSSSVFSVTIIAPPRTRPVVPGVHAVGVPTIGKLSGATAAI